MYTLDKGICLQFQFREEIHITIFQSD
jgi:hypothetical protein